MLFSYYLIWFLVYIFKTLLKAKILLLADIPVARNNLNFANVRSVASQEKPRLTKLRRAPNKIFWFLTASLPNEKILSYRPAMLRNYLISKFFSRASLYNNLDFWDFPGKRYSIIASKKKTKIQLLRRRRRKSYKLFRRLLRFFPIFLSEIPFRFLLLKIYRRKRRIVRAASNYPWALYAAVFRYLDFIFLEQFRIFHIFSGLSPKKIRERIVLSKDHLPPTRWYHIGSIAAEKKHKFYKKRRLFIDPDMLRGQKRRNIRALRIIYPPKKRNWKPGKIPYISRVFDKKGLLNTKLTERVRQQLLLTKKPQSIYERLNDPYFFLKDRLVDYSDFKKRSVVHSEVFDYVLSKFNKLARQKVKLPRFPRNFRYPRNYKPRRKRPSKLRYIIKSNKLKKNFSISKFLASFVNYKMNLDRIHFLTFKKKKNNYYLSVVNFKGDILISLSSGQILLSMGRERNKKIRKSFFTQKAMIKKLCVFLRKRRIYWLYAFIRTKAFPSYKLTALVQNFSLSGVRIMKILEPALQPHNNFYKPKKKRRI